MSLDKPEPSPTVPWMPKCVDHDFAEWAFGDAWIEFLMWNKEPIDLMDAWTELHGDLYEIEESESIVETMERLKKLYVEERAV